MTVFSIAVAVGLVVAVAYVTLAVQAFLRVRREVLAGAGASAETEEPTVYDGQGRYFAWKAASGVVASTLVLVLISVVGVSWYLLPLLAIGSSVAVVVAFLLDRRG